jgi:hypothetical protein
VLSRGAHHECVSSVEHVGAPQSLAAHAGTFRGRLGFRISGIGVALNFSCARVHVKIGARKTAEVKIRL